jgi:hypothetical protein
VSLFGIWYDDGRIDFGWLAEESRHGRPERAEYLTLEEAERNAEMHRKWYRHRTVFYPSPLNVDEEALAKTVHKMALRGRIERAEAELAQARAALDDEESPKPRPTAWERVKRT